MLVSKVGQTYGLVLGERRVRAVEIALSVVTVVVVVAVVVVPDVKEVMMTMEAAFDSMGGDRHSQLNC